MPLATYRKKAVGSPEFAYHKCGELQLYTDIPSLISFSDIENVKIPDEKAHELVHGYYACISYIDAQIGKIVEALEKSGCLNNTIIVLWEIMAGIWEIMDCGINIPISNRLLMFHFY